MRGVKIEESIRQLNDDEGSEDDPFGDQFREGLDHPFSHDGYSAHKASRWIENKCGNGKYISKGDMAFEYLKKPIDSIDDSSYNARHFLQ